MKILEFRFIVSLLIILGMSISCNKDESSDDDDNIDNPKTNSFIAFGVEYSIKHVEVFEYGNIYREILIADSEPDSSGNVQNYVFFDDVYTPSGQLAEGTYIYDPDNPNNEVFRFGECWFYDYNNDESHIAYQNPDGDLIVVVDGNQYEFTFDIRINENSNERVVGYYKGEIIYTIGEK